GGPATQPTAIARKQAQGLPRLRSVLASSSLSVPRPRTAARPGNAHATGSNGAEHKHASPLPAPRNAARATPVNAQSVLTDPFTASLEVRTPGRVRDGRREEASLNQGEPHPYQAY